MEFLDAKAVAQRYGVSLRTVQSWTRDGVLPEPLRFGRQLIRWKLETLEAWERQLPPDTLSEKDVPNHA